MKKTSILAIMLATAVLTGCSQSPTGPFQGYGSIIVSGPVSTQATVLWTPQYSSDPGYTVALSLPATVSVSYDYGRYVTIGADYRPAGAGVSGPCTVLLYNGPDLVSSGSASIASGNPVTITLSANWPMH